MKKIVKTKIISSKEQESNQSKKKGRFLTALAAGFGGVGFGMEQDKWNKRHAKMEEVYTFLVIYDDGSRETVDVVKGDDKYNELILYVE